MKLDKATIDHVMRKYPLAGALDGMFERKAVLTASELDAVHRLLSGSVAKLADRSA
jgi:hypothetical protein